MDTCKKKIADLWLEEICFKEWPRKEKAEMAKCVLCNMTFTVKHDGIHAIRQRYNSVRHTNCGKEKMQSQTMLNFVQNKHL
jgi:hypothetical protein